MKVRLPGALLVVFPTPTMRLPLVPLNEVGPTVPPFPDRMALLPATPTVAEPRFPVTLSTLVSVIVPLKELLPLMVTTPL